MNPNKRLLLFITIYFVSAPIAGSILYFLEFGQDYRQPFLQWLYYATEILSLSVTGAITPVTTLGILFTIILRFFVLFLLGGILYSALQKSLFERVDLITKQRIRKAKENPINIFISYRRSDSSGYCGRLYDRLSAFFGSDHVFIDIDAIAPGEDFRSVIQNNIKDCDLVLAVIGPNWLGDNLNDQRRIDNPDDFVRIEIEFALKGKTPIWPITIRNTNPPRPDALPDSIKALSLRQAIDLSDTRWNKDVEGLINSIDTLRTAQFN
ncbi:MAG: toll/interleukin-1 receptor domain-containing protein [Candidatus Thiodiazotropha sp. (ex Lucinoma borealis)]|nr:toll/interleukin-1 receptor domain-containing protein [Candidatus Thiodiazotropha sp. (ex Lucinoma borealis)]